MIINYFDLIPKILLENSLNFWSLNFQILFRIAVISAIA